MKLCDKCFSKRGVLSYEVKLTAKGGNNTFVIKNYDLCNDCMSAMLYNTDRVKRHDLLRFLNLDIEDEEYGGTSNS